MKRGEGLKTDPDKVRAWQQRSRRQLDRGEPLKRTRFVSRKKKRTLAYEAELEAVTPALYRRSGGRCEARIPGICTAVARHRHHRWRRGQHGPNTLANLLHVCWACHTWGHANVGRGLAIGFLLKRGDDPELHPYTPPKRVAA